MFLTLGRLGSLSKRFDLTVPRLAFYHLFRSFSDSHGIKEEQKNKKTVTRKSAIPSFLRDGKGGGMGSASLNVGIFKCLSSDGAHRSTMALRQRNRSERILALTNRFSTTKLACCSRTCSATCTPFETGKTWESCTGLNVLLTSPLNITAKWRIEAS